MYRHNFYKGKPDCNCCAPEMYNFYAFPQPIRKEQNRLDETEVIIHTDENISQRWVRNGCCPPEPITVKESKKSLIFTAVTKCLEPGTYYTFQLDRETPPEAFGYDTYINVEPCGFMRGEVGLTYTKAIHHVCPGEIDLFDNDENTLGSVEVDGEMTTLNGKNGYDGYGHNGPIPLDPAFPAPNAFCGCGYKSDKGILVPVTLDLHGNIATGKNFTTGKFPANGYAPYNNRFVLFYNNRGEFVLSRSYMRRSDYA